MPRDPSGLYTLPPGTDAIPNRTILSTPYNLFIHDLESDANTPRPIVAGGTGSSSAVGALTALGAVAKAGDVMTGNLILRLDVPTLALDSTTMGEYSSLAGLRSNSMRWQIQLGDNAWEAGGNKGSNFQIYGYNDDGTTFWNVMNVIRETKKITFSQPTDVNGHLSVLGTTNVYRLNNATMVGSDGSSNNYCDAGGVICAQLSVSGTSNYSNTTHNFYSRLAGVLYATIGASGATINGATTINGNVSVAPSSIYKLNNNTMVSSDGTINSYCDAGGVPCLQLGTTGNNNYLNTTHNFYSRNAGVLYASIGTSIAINVVTTHNANLGVAPGSTYRLNNNTMVSSDGTNNNYCDAGGIPNIQLSTSGTTNYLNNTHSFYNRAATVVYMHINASGIWPQTDNTIYCGLPSNRWFECHSANGFLTTSDARIKSDHQPIGSVLDRAMALKVTSFNYFDRATMRNGRVDLGVSNRRTLGVTAQQARQLFPELAIVQGKDATEILGVNESKIGLLALAAFQDYVTKTDARIAALEAQLKGTRP